MDAAATTLARAQALTPQLTAWRRAIHQHPELGFHETRTAALVAEVCAGLGWRVQCGVGRTGVVAEFGEGGPILALRADMDALPMQEANAVPYASQVPGVMHACGHDAHTAMLLGVAALLADHDLPGTVRLIFQPAEECADADGQSGAARMIEDGALTGVQAALAAHVTPALPVGSVEVGPGYASAGVDTIYLTLIGQGGHGALINPVIDPIHLAGHVILALNEIVGRRLPPFSPAVVSLGSIHGGTVNNVIPDRVELTGTIRFMDDATQAILHREIERALTITRALGGDYEFKLEIGYPPLINAPAAAALLAQTAADLLGPAQVSPHTPHMGAEDFAFFTQRVPGAMYFLGCGADGPVRGLHTTTFDLDERCLPLGTAILTESALRFLQDPQPILHG
jgi:amidohydrolase